MNYKNLVILFQVTIDNVGDVFISTHNSLVLLFPGSAGVDVGWGATLAVI